MNSPQVLTKNSIELLKENNLCSDDASLNNTKSKCSNEKLSSIETIKLLLERADINTIDDNARTALKMATRYSNNKSNIESKTNM